MTNAEKYKTAKWRDEEFRNFCKIGNCDKCPLHHRECGKIGTQFAWLELEAEGEMPLPCPFCGSDVDVVSLTGDWKSCRCICGYDSPMKINEEDAISAHNRVAKAVKESEVKK